MSQKRTTAIVLAAGKGSRMGAGQNKVYLDLHGKPVMTYALEAYEKSQIDEIIVVASPGDEAFVEKEMVQKYGFSKVKKVVAGGRERFESVYFGLLACEETKEEHYILVHDSARVFIRPEQINECIDAVEKYKACTMAVPTKDTIRIIDAEGYPALTPRRSDVWQMQTPQCFMLSEGIAAFQAMMESGDSDITDDVMVLERYGNRRSKMIMGSYENMKLTTPEDMIVGEMILKRYLGDEE
ncbi:MAG: 2-C-methyl-D-erythritol 4-phosphate cytidylyltransferase [Eubacteriales bacterium]|nr:2-C-methyl-D-erythritol 4-phosphate cytidylyltransferase [Eubacteriales bacterium]